MGRFSKAFPETQVSSLTTTEIRGFLLLLRNEGLSASSIARSLSSIKSFFRYLCEDKQLKVNPAEILETPRRWRKLPDILSLTDVDKLLSCPELDTPLGLRNQAMLEVLYATGMRVSELISVKGHNLDLVSGCLRTMGKGSKERIVPIGMVARKVLEDYLLNSRPVSGKGGKKVEELFFDPEGKSHDPTRFLEIVKRLCAPEQYQSQCVSTYLETCLRHTFVR